MCSEILFEKEPIYFGLGEVRIRRISEADFADMLTKGKAILK